MKKAGEPRPCSGGDDVVCYSLVGATAPGELSTVGLAASASLVGLREACITLKTGEEATAERFELGVVVEHKAEIHISPFPGRLCRRGSVPNLVKKLEAGCASTCGSPRSDCSRGQNTRFQGSDLSERDPFDGAISAELVRLVGESDIAGEHTPLFAENVWTRWNESVEKSLAIKRRFANEFLVVYGDRLFD